MRLSYHTLDVFTDTRFAGNPLAVVTGADGLEPTLMQSIAREFNLSETVFVSAPENPAHTARVRIFTPMRELPFAGHPTIGAAAQLAFDKFGADVEHEAILALEEEVGLVRVGVVIRPGAAIYAEFDTPHLAEETAEIARNADFAGALGLTRGEIGFGYHCATVFSAGVPYVFVPVRDGAALARARPVATLWRGTVLGEVGAAYLYCRDTEDPANAFAARMFSPELGLVEDPATGSAAAAFAGVVARFEGLADGDHVLPIEQGYTMGRPSLINLEVEIAAGRLAGARIGGHSVAVGTGEIAVR